MVCICLIFTPNNYRKQNKQQRNLKICFNKLYIFKIYTSDKESLKIPRSTYYI